MIFFTADTHFGHRNVIQFETARSERWMRWMRR